MPQKEDHQRKCDCDKIDIDQAFKENPVAVQLLSDVCSLNFLKDFLNRGHISEAILDKGIKYLADLEENFEKCRKLCVIHNAKKSRSSSTITYLNLPLFALTAVTVFAFC